MKEAFKMQTMLPPPRGSQSPVTMPMQSFAKMLGAPPRTKQVSFVHPPPKTTVYSTCGRLDSYRPGASRGRGTRGDHRPAGNGYVGAEQGLDSVGVPTSRRGPSDRQSRSFVWHFFSWIPRKRKAAAGFLLDNHAEWLQEDEASKPSSYEPGGPCCCRFLDGSVLGTMRWVRQCERSWNCPICSCLCSGLGNAIILGRLLLTFHALQQKKLLRFAKYGMLAHFSGFSMSMKRPKK